MRREDVGRLRRLQRDALEQQLRMGERLDDMQEEASSASSAATLDGASLLGSGSSSSPAAGGKQRGRVAPGRARVQVAGELVYNSVVAPSLHADMAEGTSSGPELQLTLTTQPGLGASSFLARVGVDAQAQQPLLQQASCTASMPQVAGSTDMM